MGRKYFVLVACVISVLLFGFVFTVDLQACTSDADCDAGQTCDITGRCLEGAGCRMAQLTAQEAVMSGGPYKNLGKMVRTATNSINAYLYDGVISDECHSCIVSQFARGIPIS